MEAGLPDRSVDPVHWRIETALIDLQRGVLGLTHLLDDLLAVGAQLTVAMGLLLDDRPDPVVLTGVGSDIGEDAQLGQVRVVFRVDAFELWVEGFVAGAGQAGIALVDLGVGISLLEVDEMVFSWDRGVHLVGDLVDLGSEAFVLDRSNDSFCESVFISDIFNGLRIPYEARRPIYEGQHPRSAPRNPVL